MDAHEQVAFGAEICCGVLGRAGNFVLIRLDIEEPGKRAALDEALRRGFGYCGVLGIKDGVAGVKSEPDPDSLYTMMHAALAFAELVAERIKPKRGMGDADEWLKRLHSLPDTRN